MSPSHWLSSMSCFLWFLTVFFHVLLRFMFFLPFTERRFRTCLLTFCRVTVRLFFAVTERCFRRICLLTFCRVAVRLSVAVTERCFRSTCLLTSCRVTVRLFLPLQSDVFAALVELLQPVALVVLMNTLPPLIRLLGMIEGFPAESRNQQAVLSRYFYFQVNLIGWLIDWLGALLVGY